VADPGSLKVHIMMIMLVEVKKKKRKQNVFLGSFLHAGRGDLPLRGSRHRWNDDIKMDFKIIGCD
jgi:hypothetical protein